MVLAGYQPQALIDSPVQPLYMYHLTYTPLCASQHKASAESLHFSQLGKTVFTFPMISILLLLFLQVVFGLPLLLFPSDAQVIAMLHLLF